MSERRPIQRAAIVVLGLVPLALLIGGLATAGGFLLSSDDGPPEPPSGVDQYRIIYDLATDEGTFVRQLEVDRPFLGHQTDRRGGPTGDVVAELYTALGISGERQPDGSWLVLHAPAQPPVGDARFDQTLQDAIAAGLVVTVGEDEIAGRTCTRSRSGGTPGEVVEPYEAGDRTYTERCIDEDGLLLERLDVVRGDTVLSLRATEIITEPSFPEERLAPPGEPLDLKHGGGAFEKVAADARLPNRVGWQLPEGPPGHNYVGRYVTIAPTYPEIPADPSTLPVMLTDVWLRGPQTYLLVQGPVADPGGRADRPDGSSQVDLGQAGRGIAVVGLAINEVRVDYRDMEVRLLGTVPSELLVDVATGMRRLAPVTTTTTASTTTTTTTLPAGTDSTGVPATSTTAAN